MKYTYTWTIYILERFRVIQKELDQWKIHSPTYILFRGGEMDSTYNVQTKGDDPTDCE